MWSRAKVRQMEVSRSTLNYKSSTYSSYYYDIYKQLESANIFYPQFNKWYFQKVVPDDIFGRRSIITEMRDGEIAGVAIIKLSEEFKLSTLKVSDNYVNSGIGLKLFEKSFTLLDTDKPFLTVSEDKLVEFKKLFKYYNFKLTSVHPNLYRNNKKEYFFNEI